MQSNINTRLQEIIDHYTKGNVLQFSESIGIVQQKIQRLLKIGNNSKYPTVLSYVIDAVLIKYPKINKVWFLTGEGDMLKKDPPVTDLNNDKNINDVKNEVTADKFDQILAAHIRLIKSTADYAEAALLREQNYSSLIQENKAYARLVNPAIASVSPLNQLSDLEKYLAAKELKMLLEAKKFPSVDAALEEWSKRDALK